MVEKYNQARTFLRGNQNEQARALFLELIASFGRKESHFINSADCHIGVAYSYPEGSPERSTHVLEAKGLLDTALVKMLGAHSSDQATINTFQKMRILYGEFIHLIPSDQAAIHQDVAARIKECSEQIPPLSNFYEKLHQAHLVQDQPEVARRIINEVMPTILGNDHPEFTLARAMGYLRLAFTFTSGDDRDRFALEAQALTFAAYDRKAELYANNDLKITVLNTFNTLFDGLSRLITANLAIQTQIREKLLEVREELKTLIATAKTNGHSEAGGSTSPDRKVTPGPVDDSWKPLRLFIAFGIAAAVIAGAVFLGRRLITKLN
jgi:hypothetical protein